MNHAVCTQTYHTLETCLANFAHNIAFLLVNYLMVTQTILTCESWVALITLERSFSSVGSEMPYQVFFLLKLLFACIAFKRMTVWMNLLIRVLFLCFTYWTFSKQGITAMLLYLFFTKFSHVLYLSIFRFRDMFLCPLSTGLWFGYCVYWGSWSWMVLESRSKDSGWMGLWLNTESDTTTMPESLPIWIFSYPFSYLLLPWSPIKILKLKIQFRTWS